MIKYNNSSRHFKLKTPHAPRNCRIANLNRTWPRIISEWVRPGSFKIIQSRRQWALRNLSFSKEILLFYMHNVHSSTNRKTCTYSYETHTNYLTQNKHPINPATTLSIKAEHINWTGNPSNCVPTEWTKLGFLHHFIIWIWGTIINHLCGFILTWWTN